MFEKLNDLNRLELLKVIDGVSANGKLLIIDRSLTGLLSILIDPSVMKEHGIDKVVILGSRIPFPHFPNMLFLCRPTATNMHIVSNIVRDIVHDKPSASLCVFKLCFVSRRNALCVRILEEQGVIGDLSICELPFELISLDDDVCSMELDDKSFKELYLDHDNSCLTEFADGILRLQSLYGYIPKILGKGRISKLLVERLLVSQNESKLINEEIVPDFSHMIVIDRSLDFVSPFLTQLTYEGLLDEMYGIKNSFIELDKEQSGLADKRKFALNSSDTVFSQVRDLSFAASGIALNSIAKRLKQNYEERHVAHSVSKLREFIGKLGTLQQEHQSLLLHINLRDDLVRNFITPKFHRFLEFQQNLVAGSDPNISMSYIESLIDDEAPITKVLRALCLLSLVHDGIKQRAYDSLKSQICHQYGHQFLSVFDKLKSLGLILPTSKSSRKSLYFQLRKPLKLNFDTVDDLHPDDISYVHAVIAPITCRILEQIVNVVLNAHTPVSVWNEVDPCIRDMPGSLIDYDQKNGVMKSKTSRAYKFLVVFIGGCTFAEISAVRHISAATGCEIGIATTGITSGNRILSSL